MDMSEVKKTNGVICKPAEKAAKMAEINARLKTKEVEKARKLLAIAGGHAFAFSIVRERIIKEIENNGSGNGSK